MTHQSAATERGRERGLERDIVVRAALELVDEVGFSGLTLRRLAERLKVKAAALYWHFENKQDLVDAMAEHIMLGEFRRTASPPAEWRALLAMVARTHRAALMRHRDGAQIMAHANMRQAAMLEGMERLLEALQAQGFSSQQALASFFTIVRYTLGCVFEEQADPRASAKSSDRAKHIERIAARYPAIAQAFCSAPVRSRNTMFELGLTLILDGIALQLPGSGLTPAGAVA